jgi:Mce-associated membrane protein
MTASAASRDPWRAWLVPGLLSVLLIGLLATSATLWSRQQEAIDSGVLVVAREQATNFFSLDHRHPDEDVDRVLDLATGTFKKDYAAKRKEIVSGVRRKKLIVTAHVPPDGVAVEFQSDHHAQAIVAVNVTTTAGGTTEEARYRTRLKLSRVNGSWLVSAVNQVG